MTMMNTFILSQSVFSPMELKEQLTSVPGMLRPFKKYLMEAGLNDGDQVVFYGCPGTCTPFIELLGFAVRDLPFELVFVPFIDESKAKIIRPVPDVGMQVSAEAPSLNPKVVVLMGGLSMPNMPVSAEMVKDLISGYKAKIVGVSFMEMFKKAGWADEIAFDLLIDATIDPVSVWA
jgi:hypothetical protein